MGLGGGVDRIEQAEFNLRGMLGEERKVHAFAIPRRAERRRMAWPNAHEVPFLCMSFSDPSEAGLTGM